MPALIAVPSTAQPEVSSVRDNIIQATVNFFLPTNSPFAAEKIKTYGANEAFAYGCNYA